MEQLKQWVRDNISFDERCTFEENLNSFLDNSLIYYGDCKDFYEINPAKVIELAKQLIDIETLYNGEENDIITIAARNGLAALVYNYMYSELENTYNEKCETIFKEKVEELLENGELTDRESLESFAKSKIDSGDYNVASHICDALYDSDCDYFEYDYSMGTLETPSGVEKLSDILHLID